jgi:hypothetical protein
MGVKFKVFIASLIAGLVTATGATTASATVGGVFYNGSSMSILASGTNPATTYKTVPSGRYSNDYLLNVQCFNPLRNVKSQWGGIYYAGKWRCMSGDGIYLRFSNA